MQVTDHGQEQHLKKQQHAVTSLSRGKAKRWREQGNKKEARSGQTETERNKGEQKRKMRGKRKTMKDRSEK